MKICLVLVSVYFVSQLFQLKLQWGIKHSITVMKCVAKELGFFVNIVSYSCF